MKLKGILFALVMLCSVGFVDAQSLYLNVDGVTYYMYDQKNKRAYVSSCKETGGHVVVKSIVNYRGDAYSVDKIGKEAFHLNDKVTSVSLPKGIAVIGESAFQGCSNLETIDIPVGTELHTIYSYAFSGCKRLQSIYLPNTLTVLGGMTFMNCKSIETISVPESISIIEEGLFIGCNSLKNVFIPNSVTEIQNGAFDGCSALESIDLPNSLVSLQGGVFSSCTSLKSMVIPENVTSLGKKELFQYCTSLAKIEILGSIDAIPEDCFNHCSSLKEVILPETVKVIGRQAFLCSGLEEVVLPDAVVSIGGHAFRECSNLRSISFGSYLTDVGAYMFYGCRKSLRDMYCRAAIPPTCGLYALSDIDKGMCTLHIPSGSEDLYKSADQWKYFFKVDNEFTAISALEGDNTSCSFNVYDLNGVLLQKDKTVIELKESLSPDVYIIQSSDGRVIKIWVK